MGAQLGRAQNFSEFLRSPRWPVCGHVSEGLICPPWLGPTREKADVKGDNLSTCSSGQHSGTLIEMKKKRKKRKRQRSTSGAVGSSAKRSGALLLDQ